MQLLSDEPLWQTMRRAGKDLIHERYAWDRVFAPLDAALMELIGG